MRQVYLITAKVVRTSRPSGMTSPVINNRYQCQRAGEGNEVCSRAKNPINNDKKLFIIVYNKIHKISFLEQFVRVVLCVI